MAQFTRSEMARILVCLREGQINEALTVVKSVLSSVRTPSRSADATDEISGVSAEEGLGNVVGSLLGGHLLRSSVPPILEKLINMRQQSRAKIGFSISDIVALGNQMEYANMSVTTVQNWVKRDVKELISTPQAGKKYSVEQMATIFIIEDLKSSLDFDSIRKVLALIFNDPTSDEDDLIHPVDFLAAYATIFEDLRRQGTPIAEVAKRAREFAYTLPVLNEIQRGFIESTIVIAVLSLQASNFQVTAKTLASTTIIGKQLT
ncbi:DUF1836 domain-containing protein [Alicyclobacillus dauci]|uniref:DUF1836 domain-containing protein n=1 Tax=Alicyclobacillus dauci TaxID=1475485 RepID=A0ABY6Z929_9BACL|nr:DUF1836 domain-containing protein [Alicyclobacillus dauci]WAH38759.1 DUF1836 domain-containing protein [Alicyclobacillus dauci]